MRKHALAILATLGLLAITPTIAHADVVRSGNTFTQTTNPCSCVTTIDGYVFQGMPYADATLSDQSAVGLWLKLYRDPNYVPLPPVTSVSTTTTVTGTVDNGNGGESTDSYGTG